MRGVEMEHWELTGKASRAAERFILSMLSIGLKMRGLPSGPRKAYKQGCYSRVHTTSKTSGNDHLHPFEKAGTIVETRTCWVQSERCVRFDFRCGPACLWVERRYKHVIGAMLISEES